MKVKRTRAAARAKTARLAKRQTAEPRLPRPGSVRVSFRLVCLRSFTLAGDTRVRLTKERAVRGIHARKKKREPRQLVLRKGRQLSRACLALVLSVSAEQSVEMRGPPSQPPRTRHRRRRPRLRAMELRPRQSSRYSRMLLEPRQLVLRKGRQLSRACLALVLSVSAEQSVETRHRRRRPRLRAMELRPRQSSRYSRMRSLPSLKPALVARHGQPVRYRALLLLLLLLLFESELL
jgi:hypothetical protein